MERGIRRRDLLEIREPIRELVGDGRAQRVPDLEHLGVRLSGDRDRSLVIAGRRRIDLVDQRRDMVADHDLEVRNAQRRHRAMQELGEGRVVCVQRCQGIGAPGLIAFADRLDVGQVGGDVAAP